ncbi:MAG: glycosyltransferase family 4 protein [Verrucomicrobia bacterium]|nr:glycosyltransferase family 4 protein [Verrucomicrobiota bacterium]
MRLAILTHEPFFPPSGGGSAEAIYLIRELVRRNHEVHLFCPVFPDWESIGSTHGIRIHPFTRWPMGRYTPYRNLKYLLYPLALAQHADQTLKSLRRSTVPEFRFDVLLSQHTISAVAAGLLRTRWKVPIILNFLDYLTGFMETWPAVFSRSGLVPWLNRYERSLPQRFNAEGVMTVSAPLAERFQATGYPANRIRVIQYGYDASLFRPLPETEADPTDSKTPVVIMHGSFDTHHLGPIALDALLHLHARRPDLRFRFLGKETPALLQLAQAVRAVAPGIPLELTGFIPYHLMAEALGGASVGLVPYEESQGVHCAFVAKAVEYLGCGIPCVSTPLENLSRYFADEPAIRFSGWTGQSFAENVLALLALPAKERRALGLSAAARVAARLDWNVIATHAADFIEQQAGLPKSSCQAAGPV